MNTYNVRLCYTWWGQQHTVEAEDSKQAIEHVKSNMDEVPPSDAEFSFAQCRVSEPDLHTKWDVDSATRDYWRGAGPWDYFTSDDGYIYIRSSEYETSIKRMGSSKKYSVYEQAAATVAQKNWEYKRKAYGITD